MVGQVSIIWQPWLKQGGGLVPLDISNHEDNMWVAFNRACQVKQSFKLRKMM